MKKAGHDVVVVLFRPTCLSADREQGGGERRIGVFVRGRGVNQVERGYTPP